MSTAEDLGPWEDRSPRHPDQRLADRVAAAFAWWLARPAEDAPTGSITGEGAFVAVERTLSRLHEGRSALFVPSGTYALRLALASLGVGPGAEVVVPALDWTATRDAVRSLGAVPVPAPVDLETLTLDPARLAPLLSGRTRAVVVCHLHGTTADVPAVREGVRRELGHELPVVEDCAAALGSTLDGVPAGCLGTAAAYSFGPGKLLSSEEGGLVLFESVELRQVALRLSGHPLRWSRDRVPELAAEHGGELPVRAHPVAAVLLAHRLARWEPAEARAAAARLAARLECDPRVERVVGSGPRRQTAQRLLPVISEQVGRPSGSVWLRTDPGPPLHAVRLAG